MWYLTVKDKVSDEVAFSCDIEVLKKVGKREMTYITRSLNIKGSDVKSVLKALQVLPWFQNNEYKIEIENPNYALLTINQCATLTALEKEGEGRENDICRIVEPVVFEDYASFFNPNIQVRCLKAPPRENKDDVCCQWEFALNSDIS